MEVKQRVANISRFFSMLLVIGSLLFMYGYGSDTHTVLPAIHNWAASFSKSFIFYLGLSVFGVINFLFNWWIKTYRDSTVVDEQSFLFRSVSQKSRVLIWFTYLLVTFNVLLTSVITYIAFVRIDGTVAENRYFFIPLIGLIIFLIVSIGGLMVMMTSQRRP